jgi:hypothetical protein
VIAKMLAFANSNTLEYEFLASVVARTSEDAYAAIELVKPGVPTFTMPPEDRPSSGGAPKPKHPVPKRADRGDGPAARRAGAAAPHARGAVGLPRARQQQLGGRRAVHR